VVLFSKYIANVEALALEVVRVKINGGGSNYVALKPS